MVIELKTEMVVEWFEVELWVVRCPVVGCYVRRYSGVWLTTIVWIAQPCVAHVTKLNNEVFKCVHVHPYPLYVIKFDYLHKGQFWKRRISWFEMIVAIIISAWLAILTQWIQFYKGMSCMIKDFTMRSSKLLSCYGPYVVNWLR